MSEQLMDALDKALGGKQATGSWHSWQADRPCWPARAGCIGRSAALCASSGVSPQAGGTCRAEPQPEAEPRQGWPLALRKAGPAIALMPQGRARLESSRARGLARAQRGRLERMELRWACTNRIDLRGWPDAAR
jgi:hypothetical protein